METPKFILVQRHWPGNFKAGQAVVHQDRFGHVVAVPPGVVPDGEVPVMYDNEEGCFVPIPADDLKLRFSTITQR